MRLYVATISVTRLFGLCRLGSRGKIELTSRVTLGCEAVSTNFLWFLEKDSEERVDADEPPEEPKYVYTGQ